MIFIDTETTGLLKPSIADLSLQPKLIEISAIKTDSELNIVCELNSLVYPGEQLDSFIVKLTSITDEMLASEPTFIELYDEICSFFLGEDCVIAHNVNFDLGVLWCELSRHGLEFNFPWPKNWKCTANESIKINGRRLKLSALYNELTGKFFDEGAHRARNDTIVLIECYRELLAAGYFE